MATTQLADVYTPSAFNRRMQENQILKNIFVSSGIAVNDPNITQALSGGSNIIDLPFYKALGSAEPNYSTDNPAVNSTPNKIGSGKQVARSAQMNNSWSTMDLSRELSDADPLGAIVGSVGSYWSIVNQARLVNSLSGILADNKANDASDMVYSVATDGAGAVADAERIGAESFLIAAQTMGDSKMNITGVCMHSTLHTRLQIQGAIKDHFDPQGALMYQTYLGRMVLVDDSMPAVAGSNRITYTVAFFGAGAVGFGEGKVQTPSELDRVASSGNGGGETILHSRVNNVYHPYGFEFTSSSVAGQTATYAELKTAANWDRVLERKNVNIAFLEVND
ncbi:MAG: major capsid protein [Lentisphaeraceae bacterium]|nr:major capsid protein [Lentisphaeraceae bacterium]